MTKDKGRGVFATKPLEKGDLLVVEKAVAEAKQDLNDMGYIAQTELVKNCSDLVSYKGVEALRISYLYDGEEKKEELKIPPIDVFTSNKYKQHSIPDMSIDKLNNIVTFNRNAYTEEGQS